ncbi:unnamed protein product [Leptidea sinapis]|uniref:Uncharacterized protein n=1 Tax=Leptidea sinapis TaxID=189913 RepID=A0A5E4QQ29_9NEOP|nr:unnamed protein product [Leptidea sinapis]
MKCPAEVRCLVCHLIFCCSDCRWKHERNAHGLTYDCQICRGNRFLCRPEELDQDFIEHLTSEHSPLQCYKCKKVFDKMEDFAEIEKCTTISELLEKVAETKKEENVDERFDSIYEKVNSEGDNFEAILSFNKESKTAVITPIMRKKYLVDYDSSEAESDDSPKSISYNMTQHPMRTPKTPIAFKKRKSTPYLKRIDSIHETAEEEEESISKVDIDDISMNHKTPNQPYRNQLTNKAPESELKHTTPTSELPYLLKLSQTVTTSTPTHPVNEGWSVFPAPGNDSPLSEIETGDSPAGSIDVETLKSEEVAPSKIKGIMSSNSILKFGSQDSTEKQVNFQDSSNNTSVKTKRVQFREDTVFKQEPKTKRVFRKPKRNLTPGPQRPKHSYNPRFQALINRFENKRAAITQTPLNTNTETGLSTPPGEHNNIAARAITFKEDSPIIDENYSKESNELFSTCMDTPATPNNGAISALTTNIAGSLQSCLSSLIKNNDEETEIQFKFVITKRKLSVKRIAEDQINNFEIDRDVNTERENIWSTVTKAMKKVIWATPHSILSSDTSSASKRKFDDVSDNESPLNHKRYRYDGKIKGRPPLKRMRDGGVSSLRSTHSAENHSSMQEFCQNDIVNQSF